LDFIPWREKERERERREREKSNDDVILVIKLGTQQVNPAPAPWGLCDPNPL
jgi:hypothetical protein